MSKASEKATAKAEAIAKLREWLKPGDTVSTVLLSVSRSGMSRVIKCIITMEGAPFDASWLISRATGHTMDRNRGGIKVSGAGMDMGFHIVYCLGHALFPEGFIPARAGKRSGRNGTDPKAVDTDGGYALNHRWL